MTVEKVHDTCFALAAKIETATTIPEIIRAVLDYRDKMRLETDELELLDIKLNDFAQFMRHITS